METNGQHPEASVNKIDTILQILHVGKLVLEQINNAYSTLNTLREMMPEPYTMPESLEIVIHNERRDTYLLIQTWQDGAWVTTNTERTTPDEAITGYDDYKDVFKGRKIAIESSEDAINVWVFNSDNTARVSVANPIQLTISPRRDS